jgi:ureidoglycolate lyase
MKIKAQPLTALAFAPFGQVLEHRPGELERRNFAAQLFSDRPRAAPNLRVQRTQPTELPLTAATIERHPHSSQMFAPISGGRYLVVVFPSDAEGRPVLPEGRAFIAEGDQAVNYDRGTWHHPFVALDGPGTFLMLRWDDGTGGDEEFLSLPVGIVIEA